MSEERQNHEETSTMTTYEYHIQPITLVEGETVDTSSDGLDLLGGQGWELVAVAGPAIAPAPHGLSMLHYFRRVRQSEE